MAQDPPELVRARLTVHGQVQGVGFRPFVWREATRRRLSGWVGNDASGVVLEVEGPAEQVESLLEALGHPPPMARVDAVVRAPLPPTGTVGFHVQVSAVDGARRALVPPDTGTCADCAREQLDPGDRRYGHPFVNCTSCGPRFTIVESVPYDRARTTMAAFPMCLACQAEYDDPADRRFHAEPVCCPQCGPALALLDAAGHVVHGPPVAGAVELLRSGQVLAVKGLGGYHLAVDARDEAAVAALRRRKHREERPFALMVQGLAEARLLCQVGPEEGALLTSPARPIVLLARRSGTGVAPSVAPGSANLGVVLAYTPLHTLLLTAFGGPLVMTSGNRSDEPIAFRDDDALTRLAGVADGFLVHDRVIRTRVDDSVSRVVRGRIVPLRRSRGYVPSPIALPLQSPEPVLACGAALKNTFCIVRGGQAFLSPHVGDLDEWSTFQAYGEGIAHLTALLDVEPAVVAHDLHPDYPSTRYAVDLPGVELVAVQHHHAHIASCLADNGATGPVIGVAFDGLGLGTDGTMWGGEFLVADLETSVRVAHLSTVPMPGGDAATREPWRMAASHLDAAYAGSPPEGLGVSRRQGARWNQVLSAARTGPHSPQTSSAGRLFDAVAALVGLRDVVTFEGQAAVELEQVADAGESGTYAVSLDGAVLQTNELVRAVTQDLLRGTPVPVIAGRFHNAIADVVVRVCRQVRETHGLTSVALSGGVFQNALLLWRCLDRLEAAGFVVLTHRQVPANDGGLSLGQAAVAAALLRAR